MLGFLENNPSVFGALFLLVSAYAGINFLIGGKRAESRFPPIDKQRVMFREKWASGRSTASLSTKLGGASRALDVVVTETELWIKGVFPNA
jgi:hypothetical protein